MDDPFWRIFNRWERRSIRRKLEDFDQQIVEARRDLARNGWNERDAELLQITVEARESWLKVLALLEQPEAPVGAAQPVTQEIPVSSPAQLPPPAPVRIQLSRTAGWRMPPNTVVVTRGTRWGNRYVIEPKLEPGTKIVKKSGTYIAVPTREEAVARHRDDLMASPDAQGEVRRELRGKNLGCWCADDELCHADVLLEIANA